jgi:putative nucleotidyltransferase with HDIG domain
MTPKATVSGRGIIDTVDLPALPAIVTEAIAVIDRPDSSLVDVETVIAQDQVIAARVLRLANSASIGRKGSVDSLSEAISLVGFEMVRALIVSAVLKDLNKRFGPVEKALWEHSVAVSLAASLIARESGHAHQNHALVSGLLHDIGTTAINNSIPDTYREVLRMVREQNMDIIAAEKDVLGFTHCDVGGTIARAWKLPAHFEAAIRFHHMHSGTDSDANENLALSMLFFVYHHTSDDSGNYEGNNHLPLCEVVCLADQMCLQLGIGYKTLADVSRAMLHRVGVSEERFLELSKSVSSLLAAHTSQLMV